jgi:hypothetical protein
MDTMPWDYWQDNGELKPEAKPVVTTLESVLKVNPQHPGANHLYIDVTEKERPQLAVQAADNLRDLVTAAGHLVHMPSHIYIRVGRYQDAVIANQKAIVADQQYLASPHPQSTEGVTNLLEISKSNGFSRHLLPQIKFYYFAY